MIREAAEAFVCCVLLHALAAAAAAATSTANCTIIDQFPIENHSEQGQSAELPLKTIGKSGRSLCNSQ
jgi:hypothetical protein